LRQLVSRDAAPHEQIEIFKALGDPVRWNIIAQLASVDELACLTLEETLPVSKPTISYHTKILHQANLISVRKEGRNYYYTLRRDVLHEVLDTIWELAPLPRPVVGAGKGYVPRAARRPARADGAASAAGRRRGRAELSPHDHEDAVVLTW
jgi:DNA-binding transcriptional ArsR family regulator